MALLRRAATWLGQGDVPRCYGRSDGTPPNPIGVRTRQCSYTSINAAADAFGLRVRCLPGADIWCVLSTAHSRRATGINGWPNYHPRPPSLPNS